MSRHFKINTLLSTFFLTQKQRQESQFKRPVLEIAGSTGDSIYRIEYSTFIRYIHVYELGLKVIKRTYRDMDTKRK